MRSLGKIEFYKKDEIYHSQHFANRMFMLKKGFVKRYQVTNEEKVIELIYGPGYIFPLSQLYKELFGINQNEENFIYVYQAMTDIEAYSLDDKIIMEKIEKNPLLYIDLYYESGLRIKSNIERLASNSYRDDYKKVAHQLFCLAREFGKKAVVNKKEHIKINVPLNAKDIAEQLNISEEIAASVIDNLNKRKLIKTYKNFIYISSLNLLKDVYI